MTKQKNIDKYLDTMGEVYESNNLMGLVDLAVRYANLVQMAYRLEMELKEAVGYGIMEDDPKNVITIEVTENAREIATKIIRNYLGQFEFDIAIENGLEQEP